MSDDGLDLGALLAGGELDREAIARLKAADPEAIRRVLTTWLPDAEADRILERIRALIEAADST
jgi:hypothetical protein